MTKGRCGSVIALTKAQSHQTQTRGQKIWRWQWGSANSQGVARQTCGMRQVQPRAVKASHWFRIKSGWLGYMARHGQGPLVGIKWKSRELKAASEQRGLNQLHSYSFFSHNSFLNNLNHDYATALCLWRLENREKSLGAEAWGCTQNTGKCLQVFSYLRFCYF